MDCGGDLSSERENFSRSGFAAIHEGQRVAGGDGGVAEGVAFGQAGLLNEPGSRDLYGGGEFRCKTDGIVGRLFGGGSSDLREPGFGDDGVFEEAARAAAIGIAFDEKHAFALANVSDESDDLLQRGLGAG